MKRPSSSRHTAGVGVQARRVAGPTVLANPRALRTVHQCRRAAPGCGTSAQLGDTASAGVGVVATFLPELAFKWAALQAAAAGQGIQLRIADFGGFRDLAMTQQILAYRDADYAAYVKQLAISAPTRTPLPIEVWRPIAPYGSSFHDFGAAVDAYPIAWPASVGNRSDALAIVQQLAPSVGLSNPMPATDPAHFQLPYSLATVQSQWLLAAANQSSQPDATLVSLPSEISSGNIPAPVAIGSGLDLQQLLTPPQLTAPDISSVPPGSGSSWGTTVAGLAVIAALGWLLAT